MASKLIRLYQKWKNSVVSIEGIKRKKNRRAEVFSPFHFYGEPEEKKISFGSGMIISRDGYILTCNHVVHEMTNIRVKIGNEKSVYQAKLIWANPKKDVAIIQIATKKELQAVKFSSSLDTPIGDQVFAIGNPFGFEHTLTSGVLGGRKRSLETEKLDYPVLIQTDAALNPGNSGGPLFNSKGRVIGMNAIIIPNYQNMGFSIPVEQFYHDIKRFIS